MTRSGWGIAASIYNWITGILTIIFGLTLIVGMSALRDILGGVGWFFPFLPFVSGALTIPVMIGFFGFLMGILGCVAGYGLMSMRSWGRIIAIVIQILSALINMGQIVFFFSVNATGLAVLPIIFFIANIVLTVGLFLPTTAQAFKSTIGMAYGGQRVTQYAYAPPPPPMNMGSPTAAMPMNAPPQMPQIGNPVPPTAVASAAYSSPGMVKGVVKTELASAAPPVLAWLIERGGVRDGKQHRLQDQVTLGRDGARCEVVLDDGKVSGEHARIRFEQNQFVIYDLASTNHTYVNGQPVQKQALRDGDQIKLGPNVTLAFMRVTK